MFYGEDHLRITKVRTADGLSPVINPDTGLVEKKVVFAPLNPQSKRLFDEQNTRLPNQLKMKIEVVKAYKPEPAPQVADTSKVDALTLKNLELEARIKQMEEEKHQAMAASKQFVENLSETTANSLSKAIQDEKN